MKLEDKCLKCDIIGDLKYSSVMNKYMLRVNNCINDCGYCFNIKDKYYCLNEDVIKTYFKK